ncbi:WAP four-disulfide core domain protein 18-like isoform X2 [Gigantopelta aegis]|uniref:WAP four-disulfide core domain protein 18-like isoform X2 n=1 Tax=Gigantopelta aegis TaxID=1735272 RepID=UPI001B88DFA1|nr:WAP four-disulfide core domain protein 18-like isoform X2 [Gigantopelta aegis]
MKTVFCALALLVLASASPFRSYETRATSHPGHCPASSGLAGICQFIPGFNCLSDAECAADMKCCSEGCGRVCKEAIQPRRGKITQVLVR